MKSGRTLAPMPSGFSYQATKDGRVRISRQGRVVTTLAGRPAAVFLERVRDAGEEQTQLAMAKATKHYKHGNERR